MTETDLLPPDLQQLFVLFSSLPNVRFPELEASSLQDDVARLKERHLELLHIEAQLAAVRAALDDEQDRLNKKGQRLHAYLKVFAEQDEQLANKLEALSLPRPKRVPVVRVEASTEVQAAPKRRGRPRKVVEVSEPLFTEPAAVAQ